MVPNWNYILGAVEMLRLSGVGARRFVQAKFGYVSVAALLVLSESVRLRGPPGGAEPERPPTPPPPHPHPRAGRAPPPAAPRRGRGGGGARKKRGRRPRRRQVRTTP